MDISIQHERMRSKCAPNQAICLAVSDPTCAHLERSRTRCPQDMRTVWVNVKKKAYTFYFIYWYMC